VLKQTHAFSYHFSYALQRVISATCVVSCHTKWLGYWTINLPTI